MTQKPLKIREFIVKEEKNPRSFCDSFIYEPSNYEEEKLGTLLLVGEVLNFHTESRYLLNYLASLIRREYYSGPKNEPFKALEASLKKANFIIAEVKRREGINIGDKIKFSVAALAQNSLSFSQIGKTYALLLRTGQIFNLSKKFFQFSDSFPNNFLHVLRGQIYLNDKIFFATENFFKILTLKELKQILEIENLEEANRNLEIILSGSPRMNMAAVLTESLIGTPPPKPKIIPKKKKAGALTLEEIFAPQKTKSEEKITLFEEAPLASRQPIPEIEIGTRIPPSAGRITLIATKIAARIASTASKKRLIAALPSIAFKRKNILKKIYLCASLVFTALLIIFIAKNGALKKEIIIDYLPLDQAKKKIEESDNYLIAKKTDLALKNLAEAQALVKTSLLAHFEGKKISNEALDEAIKLATEIRQKIIKIEAMRNKK